MATNILFIEIDSRSPEEMEFLKKLGKKQSNGATFAQNLLFYDTENQEEDASNIILNITFKTDESNGYFYSSRNGNEEYFKKLVQMFRERFRADRNMHYHRVCLDVPEFSSEVVILRPNGTEEIVSIKETIERKLALLETISGEYS
jgi:hypothetical protein